MNQLNTELIEKELHRAEDALKAAEKLFEEALFADAISRAYYACLHAAKAALLKDNITVNSHKAVITLFGQQFIKTNKLEKEYGMILREEKEDREAGDYDVLETFENDRTQQRVDDARKFIIRITKFLKKES